jgi:hypothetical protein
MAMPDELRDLIRRFNELGAMLPPRDDDLDAMDQRELANVDLVTTEMRRVGAQIDSFLIQRGLRPWFGSRTRS